MVEIVVGPVIDILDFIKSENVMTGQELINFIHKYNLENETIIPNDILNGEDGEYIRFTCSDENIDYQVLWLKTDFYQDVEFCKEGERTYGLFTDLEKQNEFIK